jgi:succinate dehydrogenase / fumarate reductase, cytochrome b subunit
MMGKFQYFCSTIGRKQLVALTALGLSGFVMAHMAGNLLMFVSPQAYNEYGHGITHGALYLPLEFGLAAAFLVHAFIAIRLKVRNLGARGGRYAVSPSGEKAADRASSTMAVQGLIILVFVILHLKTFRFGTHYEVDYGEGPIRDLFRLVVEVFHSPGYTFWYIAALLILGAHLTHGIKSMFQTWGVHHPRLQPALKVLSWAYALIVAGGFIAQPVYVFFFHHA